MFRHIILYTYIIIGSGMLFANIYNSMVDAAIWGANIPNSIETARNYFNQITPADFYSIFGTILHPLSFMALFSCWKSFPKTRWYLGSAVVLYFLVDAFTILYFIPRNDILFRNTPLTEIETIKQAWQQWNAMNWLRSFISLAGVFCCCIALHKTIITNHKINNYANR